MFQSPRLLRKVPSLYIHNQCDWCNDLIRNWNYSGYSGVLQTIFNTRNRVQEIHGDDALHKSHVREWPRRSEIQVRNCTVLVKKNNSQYSINYRCYRSILAVRKKHRHGSQVGVLRVNRFINQRDMAVTQNSFMGHAVAYHDTFGMPYDPENFLALCHFWRVIGYLLGIEDRFNLCAGDDLAEIRSRSQAIFRHIIIPGLLHAPKDFEMMTEAYFEGLGGFSSEFETDKFIYISQKTSLVPGFYITEEECHQQKQYMKKYSHYIPDAEAILRDMEIYPKRCKAFTALKWSTRWDITFTNYLLLNIVPHSPVLRKFFNFINCVRIFFLEHFPVLAMWKFGYSNAWVSVLKE